MSNKELNTVRSIQGGSRQDVLEIVKRDPRLASGISKLIAPNRTKRERVATSKSSPPNTSSIRDASFKLIDDQRDSRTIINMMPDIEMSMSLLVAAILNPKDLTTVELTYQTPLTRMDGLLTNGVTELIRAYFNDVHKIKTQLPKILQDALFLKGAHPVAIIPENALDAIINAPNAVSTESLNAFFSKDQSLKTKGLIGPSKELLSKKQTNNHVRTLKNRITQSEVVSLESFAEPNSEHRALTFTWLEKDPSTKQYVKKADIDKYITFHDNPDLLKMPMYQEHFAKRDLANQYYPDPQLDPVEETELSVESQQYERNVKRLTLDQAESLLYKKRTLETRIQAILPTQDQISRPSVAEPLIIDLPFESVFPVFLPGDESKHVAYIVLIDANGYFVTDRYTDQQIREMSQMNNPGAGSFSSALISRVNRLGTNDTQGLGINDFYANHLEYCARVYGEMIEADFVDRVSNGLSGRKVSLGDTYDLGRIMLARRLAEQNTQILFLPREVVSYFAFNYRKDGVGESLIDQIKPLLAMRLSLMMANLLGQLKNSIGRTKVHAELDEDDADALETKEKIIDEVIRSRQLFANFPSRIQGPVDVLNYLAGAGVEFSWGEHPRLPNIKLDVTYDSTDHTLPSSDLEEEYKKRTILKFGIPPEQIDAALGPDFAVQAINSNVMLSKQVLQRQMEFAEQLSLHIRKIIKSTPSLFGEIIKLIERNIKHVKLENVTDETQLSPKLKREIATKVATEYIDGLDVTLPAPNSITHRNQIEAISDFEELIDKGIKYYLNPEFLTEAVIGANLSDQVDLMAASVKAVKLREFMAEHGILPEIAEIGLTDADGRKHSIYDAQVQHARQIMEGFTKMFETIQDPKAVAEARLNQNTDIADSDSSSTTSSGDTSAPPEGMDDTFGADMPSLDESTLPPEDSEDENTPEDTSTGGGDETSTSTPPEVKEPPEE